MVLPELPREMNELTPKAIPNGIGIMAVVTRGKSDKY
jgi:hypothetical protein